jgi:hypothetical protein
MMRKTNSILTTSSPKIKDNNTPCLLWLFTSVNKPRPREFSWKPNGRSIKAIRADWSDRPYEALNARTTPIQGLTVASS